MLPLRNFVSNGDETLSVNIHYRFSFVSHAQHLGEDPAIIGQLLAGTHPFSQRLKAARRPMVVVGSALLARPDGGLLNARLQQLAQQVSETYNFTSSITR